MREYNLNEAIDVSNRITIGSINLIGTAVTFVIGVILIKLLWAWTIPELFPAAVHQGLILGEITWLVALKTTALVAILMTSGSLIAGRWDRLLAWGKT